MAQNGYHESNENQGASDIELESQEQGGLTGPE